MFRGVGSEIINHAEGMLGLHGKGAGPMWKTLVMLVVLATPAAAGPWPQGKGRHFLSLSATYEAGVPGMTVYHAWGLTDRLTLLIAGSGARGGAVRAMVSLSRAVWTEGTWRMSVALGAGLYDDEGAASAGVALGRGVTLFGHSGWLTVEAQAIATMSRIEGRVDGTLGVTFDNGVKAYSQISVAKDIYQMPVATRPSPPPIFGWTPPPPRRRNPTDISVALAAAIPLGSTTWLDLGVSQALRGGGAAQIKFGIWKEF